MARRTRSTALETRTNRLKLEIRKRAYGVMIAPGVHLLYRRCKGPGTWSYRRGDQVQRFSIADDHEVANGDTVRDYWQALERAKELARVGEGDRAKLISVDEAIDDYEADLEMRGGRKYNASSLRLHVPETMRAKTVALLSERELRDWRSDLIKQGLKPKSAERIGKSLKAALNLAASDDKRIGNVHAWKHGLKKLPDSEAARNIILPDAVVTAVVRGCYDEDQAFGLLIDTLSETGARESQVFRLTPHDLHDDDPAAPRLMMSSSRKGRNRKIEIRPLPISPRLARALRLQARGRAVDAPLFDKLWNLARLFAPVAQRLKLDPKATPYCLRHSSIVRMLLKGVPTRVVAAHHDTSVVQIEKHYSRYILNPVDALTRAALIDLEAPTPASNVTPLRAA